MMILTVPARFRFFVEQAVRNAVDDIRRHEAEPHADPPHVPEFAIGREVGDLAITVGDVDEVQSYYDGRDRGMAVVA